MCVVSVDVSKVDVSGVRVCVCIHVVCAGVYVGDRGGTWLRRVDDLCG